MAFQSFAQMSGINHSRNRLLIGRKFIQKPPIKRYQSTIENDCNQPTHISQNKTPDQTKDDKYEQLMSSTTLSLAPMMEYTDRHFRHLVRLVSQNTLLYSEMVTANAITHERKDAKKTASDGKSEHKRDVKSSLVEQQSELDVKEFGYDMTYLRRFIGQGQTGPYLEGPSVLQLGGSDPQMLAEAASTVTELQKRGYCDYTALNLNCGCPSPKVAGKGCFGAALMEDPKLVRDLVTGMHQGCSGAMPITVKCRIGTDLDYKFTKSGYDDMDDDKEYARLRNFIETVASSGVVTDFQMHARIAVLNKKFSPADNRKIPKLKYGMVTRLVEDYPDLTFSLNGGIETLGDVKDQLDRCPGLKGVMVGRAWAANPWSFSAVDDILYNTNKSTLLYPMKPKNRLEVLKEYGRHADAEEDLWDPVRIRRFIVKAVQPLFAGEANAKKYRIALDEIAGRPKKLMLQGKTLEGEPPLSELIINAAIDHLSEEALLRTPEETYFIEQENMFKSINSSRESNIQIVKNWQTARKEESLTKEKGVAL